MANNSHIVFVIDTMQVLFTGSQDECAAFVDNYTGDWSTIDVGDNK